MLAAAPTNCQNIDISTLRALMERHERQEDQSGEFMLPVLEHWVPQSRPAGLQTPPDGIHPLISVCKIMEAK